MSDKTEIKGMGAIPHAGGSPFACGREIMPIAQFAGERSWGYSPSHI